MSWHFTINGTEWYAECLVQDRSFLFLESKEEHKIVLCNTLKHSYKTVPQVLDALMDSQSTDLNTI